MGNKAKHAKVPTMTGVEWNEFYNDEDYWDEKGHDGAQIEINGVVHDDYATILAEPLGANDKVRILGGAVSDDDDENEEPFIEFYRRWCLRKTHTELRAFVPNEKLDDVTNAIKGAGGKILESKKANTTPEDTDDD